MVKFSLVAYIINIFVKAALLYSAMTVSVAVCSSSNLHKSVTIGEEDSVSIYSSKSPNGSSVRITTSTPRLKSPEGDFNLEIKSSHVRANKATDTSCAMKHSPQTESPPGIPGLISP